MRRGFGRLALAIGVPLFLACELDSGVGGGGGGGGLGPEQTATLASTDTLDGWVRTDGNVARTGTQVVVGDLVVGGGQTVAYRGFYSFDISSIPAGSLVTSADLRLYQFSFAGNPYTDLGNVIADHLDYGATLDATDYNATAIAANIGTVSTNATTEFKTLSVTARVAADVAATRPRAQFRLRFSIADSNTDGSADLAQFTDAEYSIAAQRPQLVVKYRPPATP